MVYLSLLWLTSLFLVPRWPWNQTKLSNNYRVAASELHRKMWGVWLDAPHYLDPSSWLPFTLLGISRWGSATKTRDLRIGGILWDDCGETKPCERMKYLMLKDLDDGSGSEGNLTMVVQVLLFGELVILPASPNKKLRIIVNKTFLHPARPSWKVLPFECLGCSHIQHDKAQPG